MWLGPVRSDGKAQKDLTTRAEASICRAPRFRHRFDVRDGVNAAAAVVLVSVWVVVHAGEIDLTARAAVVTSRPPGSTPNDVECRWPPGARRRSSAPAARESPLAPYAAAEYAVFS
jgi:hypothetical protein